MRILGLRFIVIVLGILGSRPMDLDVLFSIVQGRWVNGTGCQVFTNQDVRYIGLKDLVIMVCVVLVWVYAGCTSFRIWGFGCRRPGSG